MAITDDERREVASWAAGSAERVLPLFETIAPGDARPRGAIEAARAFADGGRRTRALFGSALAAHRAGREVGDPVGLAVARSASLAAAAANIHGEATIGTLGHILGPAAYAALARERWADGDAGAGDEEVRWAVQHVTSGILALIHRVPPAPPGHQRVDEIQALLEAELRAIDSGRAGVLP